MQNDQEKQEVFLQAQKDKKKLLLTHYSGQHNLYLTSLCIPIEHVPPLSDNGPDFFYFWDSEADVGERIFGRPPSEIQHMELTEESFDPNDYIIPNIYNAGTSRDIR